MSLQLEAIKFNHDSTSANTDALNLRKNASAFVHVPEWRRGISVNPEDSPAAYALKPTQGNTLTVQAQFRGTDPELQNVEVRAIDGAPAWCLGTEVFRDRASLTAGLRPLHKQSGLFVKVFNDVPVGAVATAIQAGRDVGFEQVTYVPVE